MDNKAPQSNPFTQRIAKNKVPPPGGRWWRQPPKGVHFRRPQGGSMVFPRAKPGCPVFTAKGGIKNGAPKGAVPRQRSDAIYLPRAEPSTRPGGVSRSRTEPLAPRAVRPGGAINPRGEAASTYGNTGKHRLYPSSTPFLFNISYLYSINHSHMQKIVMPSDSPRFSFDFLKFPY